MTASTSDILTAKYESFDATLGTLWGAGPEIGHLAAIIGLVAAIVLSVLGHVGAATRRRSWVENSGSFAVLQLVTLVVAFALLVHAFLKDDYSVVYVATNSNTLLPWYYKVSAVWGAHEGSFLLWTLIMAVWTFAVAMVGRRLPYQVYGRVLGTLGLLNTGFLLFLLQTSNPFLRLVPNVPTVGADLNPLLQDFGLIVHPPLLYTGYVGFSVAFAFGVAGLISGRLDATWARWTRPWTNVAWAFLTVGITLGSWWAYYELGWGGWWFWDPVENASFMPWLAGTALIHSLAVTEKRSAFRSWTVLLTILTFSLCLLGAFIVRSGVLTSVHAFAVDPERGVFLLVLLGVTVGGSLALYAIRVPAIRSRIAYMGLSRELFLLINNALFVVAVAVVLVGTLYPLAYEAVTGGDKISVGPPYFNRLFVPLMGLLAVFLALVPVARWKRTPIRLFRRVCWLLLASMLVGAVFFVIAIMSDRVLNTGSIVGVVIAVTLALWLLLSHSVDFIQRKGARPLGYLGMLLAHIGFAIGAVGVAVTSVFSHETEVRLSPGDTVELNARQYHFVSVTTVNGPNYIAQRAKFDVGEISLYPEKRNYLARNSVMTEAGIEAGFFQDLYVALGEPLPDGSWGVRIQEKVLVRWVWCGGLLVCFGGLLAVMDGRYRRLALRRDGLATAVKVA